MCKTGKRIKVRKQKNKKLKDKKKAQKKSDKPIEEKRKKWKEYFKNRPQKIARAPICTLQ